jgi:uncharacterized protein YjbK
MKINPLTKMYHDRLYHPNHHAKANTKTHQANHYTPDYVLHLSPEALRLYKLHLQKNITM